MTAEEINILIKINRKRTELIAKCDDIKERTMRMNTLNSVIADIIDLIIERRDDDKN